MYRCWPAAEEMPFGLIGAAASPSGWRLPAPKSSERPSLILLFGNFGMSANRCEATTGRSVGEAPPVALACDIEGSVTGGIASSAGTAADGCTAVSQGDGCKGRPDNDALAGGGTGVVEGISGDDRPKGAGGSAALLGMATAEGAAAASDGAAAVASEGTLVSEGGPGSSSAGITAEAAAVIDGVSWEGGSAIGTDDVLGAAASAGAAAEGVAV